MKERICIGKRPLKNGVVSLFLDYRLAGERKRENLHLYLHQAKTASDRNKNAETMLLAKSIRDKREGELLMMEQGINVQNGRITKFIPYARELMKKLHNNNTIIAYNSAISCLAKYDDPFIQELTIAWFEKFSAYLQQIGLSPATIRLYVSIISAVLTKARNAGIIQSKPSAISVTPKLKNEDRQFLTIEELKRLIATECKDERIKRAFLFCCFTGLRHSDCIALTREMIVDDVIILRQQKTSELVRIPLSVNAKKYLPDYEEGCLFKLPKSESQVNKVIQRWCDDAGIRKHITFHCSRHTFATIYIALGVDLYVVSKILGHSSIKTTEIYAKVIDDVRKKAVSLIPEL